MRSAVLGEVMEATRRTRAGRCALCGVEDGAVYRIRGTLTGTPARCCAACREERVWRVQR